MITPTEFWGRNVYGNPPLTDEAIRIAEERLEVSLPVEFLSLLRQQNGGYTRGFVFLTTMPTSWAPDHVPMDQLSGIVTDPDHKSPHNILLTQYMTGEWELPPNQVLLNGDGHWWITLDYRASTTPKVTWLDVEIGQDITIASSFGAFLAGLVPESELDASST